MANVTKAWKRWMAISCSHGIDADPRATDAVLKFAKSYRPHTRIHLGDAIDLACLRGGARQDADSPDRAESLLDDLLAGLSFLHEYRPSIYFHGNHEGRAVAMQNSPNAIIAYASGRIIGRLSDDLAKYKTEIVPYAGMSQKSIRYLGNTAFLHGSLYNVSAARDTAETIGTHCVFGHTHRVAVESARILADAVGYNIGCLIRMDAEYAAGRRQTLAWRHAFAYGEYSDNFCSINLCVLSPHYRLP